MSASTGSIRHPLARALLVLTFTTGLVDAVSFLGLGRVFTAMFSGALAGALLLKTSLVLPPVAAAGLALATWLVYVPAARRGARSAG